MGERIPYFMEGLSLPSTEAAVGLLEVRSTAVTNERQLIEQTLAGDNAAFGALVAPCLPLCRSGIHRILQDDQDTQDALTEALVHLRAELPSFTGKRKFSAWAYHHCLNEALLQRRSRAHRGEASYSSEGSYDSALKS
jgi:DNA-directed RNA polymerase specialized sigma24 family protein